MKSISTSKFLSLNLLLFTTQTILTSSPNKLIKQQSLTSSSSSQSAANSNPNTTQTNSTASIPQQSGGIWTSLFGASKPAAETNKLGTAYQMPDLPEQTEASSAKGNFEGYLAYILRTAKAGQASDSAATESNRYPEKCATALREATNSLGAKTESHHQQLKQFLQSQRAEQTAAIEDLHIVTSLFNHQALKGNLAPNDAQKANTQLKKEQSQRRELLSLLTSELHQQDRALKEERRQIRKAAPRGGSKNEQGDWSDVSDSDDDDHTDFAQKSLEKKKK